MCQGRYSERYPTIVGLKQIGRITNWLLILYLIVFTAQLAALERTGTHRNTPENSPKNIKLALISAQ